MCPFFIVDIHVDQGSDDDRETDHEDVAAGSVSMHRHTKYI